MIPQRARVRRRRSTAPGSRPSGARWSRGASTRSSCSGRRTSATCRASTTTTCRTPMRRRAARSRPDPRPVLVRGRARGEHVLARRGRALPRGRGPDRASWPACSRRLGLAGGRLGVERPTVGLTVNQFQQLVAQLPDAVIEDSFPAVEIPRRVKSPAEIGYMRRAAALTDRALDAACAAVKVGVSDGELAATITNVIYGEGGEVTSLGPIVAVGYRAGAPHSSFNGTRVQAGDSVFLELTAQVRRYTAPIMRSVWLGEPSAEILRLADAGAAAVETIVRTARPGLPASEVARAARAELEPILDQVMFHNSYGYPVGIGFPPTWTESLGLLPARATNDPARGRHDIPPADLAAAVRRVRRQPEPHDARHRDRRRDADPVDRPAAGPPGRRIGRCAHGARCWSPCWSRVRGRLGRAAAGRRREHGRRAVRRRGRGGRARRSSGSYGTVFEGDAIEVAMQRNIGNGAAVGDYDAGRRPRRLPARPGRPAIATLPQRAERRPAVGRAVHRGQDRRGRRRRNRGMQPGGPVRRPRRRRPARPGRRQRRRTRSPAPARPRRLPQRGATDVQRRDGGLGLRAQRATSSAGSPSWTRRVPACRRSTSATGPPRVGGATRPSRRGRQPVPGPQPVLSATSAASDSRTRRRTVGARPARRQLPGDLRGLRRRPGSPTSTSRSTTGRTAASGTWAAASATSGQAGVGNVGQRHGHRRGRHRRRRPARPLRHEHPRPRRELRQQAAGQHAARWATARGRRAALHEPGLGTAGPRRRLGLGRGVRRHRPRRPASTSTRSRASTSSSDT